MIPIVTATCGQSQVVADRRVLSVFHLEEDSLLPLAYDQGEELQVIGDGTSTPTNVAYLKKKVLLKYRWY